MIRNFILNSKIGILVGTLGSILFNLWLILSPSRGPLLPDYTVKSIIFYIFCYIFWFFLPLISSGAISGAIIEGLYIKKFILFKHFFTTYYIGSSVGCIIGGLSFFPLGVFFGTILAFFPAAIFLGCIIGSVILFPICVFLKIGITRTILFIGIAGVVICSFLIGWLGSTGSEISKSIGEKMGNGIMIPVIVALFALGQMFITILITLIMATIGTFVGLFINIAIRKTIIRLVIKHQNKFWGLHVGEKEIKILENILVVGGIGFIFVSISLFCYNNL